jgi:hypothetical protein
LLARQVDVQWFEGVAIVQGVCRQLASDDEFPATTQIGIGADGAVRILATTATKAVPAAAHLLAGLLSDDVPVRLRLAVSQATGESPTIRSLREFSETLAYFERPDNELIVRNLFDRAMLAGVRKQADEPKFQNIGTDEKRDTAAKPSSDKKAIRRQVAIAAAVVITIGAASWLVLSTAPGGHVTAAVSGIVNAVVGAPEARVNEPLENSTPSKEGATNGTKRTHSSTANNTQHQSGEARKSSAGALGARIPSLVPSLTSVMAPMPMPSQNASNATEITQTYVIVASEPGKSESDQIYSKSDSEVMPPRQVYPALPAEQPTAPMSRALTVVDLVIAPDGVVERVRLRTPPRDIHEFMLLSAAKAWRFQPALLDGRPVRFLHSVALTSFK